MHNPVIYLEADDEITTVVEKIRRSPADKLTVVVPKRAVVMQSIVNLQILGRQASQLNKTIAIVCTDAGGRALAQRAGLLVKKHISDPFPGGRKKVAVNGDGIRQSVPVQQIEKLREIYKEEGIEELPKAGPLATTHTVERAARIAAQSPTKKIFAKKTVAPVVENLSGEEVAAEDRLAKVKAKVQPKSRLPRKWVRYAILFVVLALGILGTVLALVLPKATIVVVPKSQAATADPEITVQVGLTTADPVTLTIPGTLVQDQADSTKTFQASGTKTVGTPAVGAVNFSNSYSSDPRTIAAGTKLTVDGKTYKLTSAVTIPGATISGGDTVPGTATGNAQAENIGDTYNRGASTLAISGLSAAEAEKITARSDSFTGGTSEDKKIVTADDIKNGTAALLEDLGKQLLLRLPTIDLGGKKILTDAIIVGVDAAEPSLKVGDEGTEFSLKVTASAKAIVFDEAELKSIAESRLARDLPSDQEFLPDKAATTTYAMTAKDLVAGKMALKAHVEKFVIPKLDLAQFQRDLIGKTAPEARAYFSKLSQIDHVEVKFWPFWVQRIPKKTDRISITLDV